MKSTRRSRRVWRLPALTLWCLWLGSAPLCAQEYVWLMSTRGLCGAEAGSAPECWQWSAGAWQSVAEEVFCKKDKQLPLNIVVHGNRTNDDEAAELGFQVSATLKSFAAGKPFRLLVWSWPADRIRGGNRRDVQVKAARSDVESFYLGRLLNRLDPQTPVTLIGYSFGARAITGALHLAAGGSLDGRTLAEPPRSGRKPLRAVLVAAAENADWLAPGHCHERALIQVDQILLTLNGCDRALKLYRHMYRLNGPPAMGFVGPCCLADDCRDKLQLVDVSCSVGRTHDWDCYFAAPELREFLPWFTRLHAE